MPDLRAPAALAVLDTAGGAAEELAGGLLDRLLAALTGGSPLEAFARAGAILDLATEDLADLLSPALLAAALAGQRQVADRLPASPPWPTQQSPPVAVPPAPPWQLLQLQSTLAALPPALQAGYIAALPPALAGAMGAGPPPSAWLPAAAGAEGGVFLPLIEAAIDSLRQKQLADPAQLAVLDAEAKRRSVETAANLTAPVRQKLYGLLAASVAGGEDLRAFRTRAREELPEDTFLSRGRVETAFRDGVQEAYAAGMEAILAVPLVDLAFPYIETLPIRDTRLSAMCAIASRSGIQKTAIYRRDDPTWQQIRPPRHHNCRCGQNPLTVEEAARRGIAEASRWLQTGRPPAPPAHVRMPNLPGR